MDSTTSALTETCCAWPPKAGLRRASLRSNSTRWRSKRAAPCRRRAGQACATAAAIFTPSTGAHSLFADTLRSLRSLAVAHRLGHALKGENDRRISLLDRLVQHASVTAEFNVYYGEGRDAYDCAGAWPTNRFSTPPMALIAALPPNKGTRPSPRGRARWRGSCADTRSNWNFSKLSPIKNWSRWGDARKIESMMRRAAQATCDYYSNRRLQTASHTGIQAPRISPSLVTGATSRAIHSIAYEPVDSSAAAIAAQGLWRFATYLNHRPEEAGRGHDYRQTALTIARTLFDEPYLSTNPRHQGLILHSVYHRPRGWDYVPAGRQVPCGESSMWGDYHARELALLIKREANREPYPTFFNVSYRSI